MKIAIDISPILYGTGVSVYTKEIVRNLLAHDKQNQYVLFGGSLRRYKELKSIAESFGGNSIAKIFPIPPTAASIIWNKFHVLPIEKLIGDVDVVHSSDWTQPPTKAFKITTVHDIAPIRYPRETHPHIVSVHRERLEWVKKEADRVIVPSISTKSDLIDFGVKEEKIRVIPEAASIIHQKASGEEIKAIKLKYKIDSEYVVTVGVGQRKNTQRLIEAFEKASAGRDLKLVLIGRSVEKFKDIRGLRFTGFVSDKEFTALISGASAMVYPSLYEGFGLPILEAFTAGTPVVTSNVSSLPEVAADAAILVDPYEVDSISEGIISALKRRKGLAEKGEARARKYSWEKAALETLAVYREFQN